MVISPVTRFLLVVLSAVILVALFGSSSLFLRYSSLPLLPCSLRSSACFSHKHNPSSITLTVEKTHLTDTPHHPLDPLTITEINSVRSVIRSYSVFSSSPTSLAFHSLTLLEPDKKQVLSWKRGQPLPPRRASSVVRFLGNTHVITVDLAEGKVVSHSQPNNNAGYPTMTVEDMTASASAPLSDSRFNKSVLDRGVRLSDLACLPISTGWFGPKEENRRVIKVQCYSMEGTSNFYMRPIEGLTVVVDMDTMEVIDIVDVSKDVPIPTSVGTEYRYSEQQENKHKKIRDLNPISIEQPDGPSFVVEDGHFVKWAGWEFHLKPDSRAGVILSTAFAVDPDTGERRSVMYKGFTSELFVPYMDPTNSWYFKTYMDAGEYGFGLQSMPLVPLNDCPRNAYFMDAVFVAGDGRPYVKENMICLFERYGGDIGWRHSECPITDLPIREARPKVTLVARMAASVANYDYIVDWEFQTDGLIRITVGLSGMLMVRATPYTHANQIPKEEETYGSLISENIVGVIHDHYITFHLDMDVDGGDNSFVKVHLEREMTGPGESPRKSYLKATRTIAETETDAKIKLKLYDPYEFHVINPLKTSRVGNPIGYKIVPAATAANLMDPSDPPMLRAAFTNNQIWVTPYNKSEIWAGGDFVYQSRGDDTLATWSER